jgi:hypothetical protein
MLPINKTAQKEKNEGEENGQKDEQPQNQKKRKPNMAKGRKMAEGPIHHRKQTDPWHIIARGKMNKNKIILTIKYEMGRWHRLGGGQNWSTSLQISLSSTGTNSA